MLQGYLWQAAGLRRSHLRRTLPPRRLSCVPADGKEGLQVRKPAQGDALRQGVRLRTQVQAPKGLSEAHLQQEVLRRRLPALSAELRQQAELQEPQVRIALPQGLLLSLQPHQGGVLQVRY